MIARAVSAMSFSHSDLPTGVPLREQEGVGHAAAEHQDVDPRDQIAEQLELGRHLGAADQRDERPLRVVERAGQRLDLGLHQAARRRRQTLGQAGDRGMRAMRGRERIVDVERRRGAAS